MCKAKRFISFSHSAHFRIVRYERYVIDNLIPQGQQQ